MSILFHKKNRLQSNAYWQEIIKFIKKPNYGYYLLVFFSSFLFFFYQIPHFSMSKINSTIAVSSFTFISTLISPFAGLSLLIVSLGIFPSFTDPLSSLGIVLIPVRQLGFDLSICYIVACSIRLLAGIEKIYYFRAYKWLILSIFWISLSSIVSIIRNLNQSGSNFSIRGLLFNLSNFRDLGWHADYFPINDIFAFSIFSAVLLSVTGLIQKDNQKTTLYIFFGVFISCLLNFILSFFQNKKELGWFYSAADQGLKGFWPDIHSFAGFMSICLFVSLWSLRQRDYKVLHNLLGYVLLIMSGTCLIWSGSRFTIFLTLGILAILGIVRILSGSKKEKVVFTLLLFVGGSGVFILLNRGIRGTSFDSLMRLSQNINVRDFNDFLSYRPETIFHALKMYSNFPFFGLGQGSFVRLSNLNPFSLSPYFLKSGGENAHSYPVQILCELGPIGFLLLLSLISSAFKREKKGNLNISSYAILGILAGNLFTHSLLTREMLIFIGPLIGVGLGKNQCPIFDFFKNKNSRYQFYNLFLISLTVLFSMLTILEIGLSFNKYPFRYGEMCHVKQILSHDNWSSGLLSIKAPFGAKGVKINLIHGHQDVGRNRLDVEISLEEEGKEIILDKTSFFKEEETFIDLKFSVNSHNTNLNIKTSNCFVPLNLGISMDHRRLGLHIKSLIFY